MRSLRAVLGACGLLVGSIMLWNGCIGYNELEPSDVCDETGYAIANRTVLCTDDPDLANARYEKFRDHYRCIAVLPAGVGEPPADGGLGSGELFTCAIELRKLTCDQVSQFGDDLDKWLTAAGPICERTVEFQPVDLDGGVE